MSLGVIYKITNKINNKVYIGKLHNINSLVVSRLIRFGTTACYK